MNTGLKVEMEVLYEAQPPEGVSLDQLKRTLIEKGYTILERNPTGFLIGKDKSTMLRIYNSGD